MNIIHARKNGLSNQRDALLDYINVLTTEEFAGEQIVNDYGTGASSTETPDKVLLDIELCVFKVSGLKLAIINDKINKIIDLPEEFTVSDQQVQHIKSGSDIPGSIVNVIINTATLVMPDRKGCRPQKLVIIKDSNVGFTCDEVITSLILEKKDIRWRTDSTKRKWLSGTIAGRQMALLDIDYIIGDINR